MTKNEIISMLRQGFNESEIARKTSFSKTTVCKWAKTDKGVLENVKSCEGCLEDFLCKKPRYDSTSGSKRTLDQQIIEFIVK
ncbi:MAG: helix-turn-helix domain-containing protein [Ignavibacteria bacterium]|nr:helix-turn-helix domain-containing protein [Ignavibacteria bacterium]